MKKIYIANNACLNSSYDFNIVKKALSSSNYIIVNDINEADTCIYAGCGVRNVWVDNAIDEINKATLENKELNIIATGCFSFIEPHKIRKNVHAKNIKLMSFEHIVEKYTDTKFDDLDKSLSQEENTNFEGENKQKKRVTELKTL